MFRYQNDTRLYILYISHGRLYLILGSGMVVKPLPILTHHCLLL